VSTNSASQGGLSDQSLGSFLKQYFASPLWHSLSLVAGRLGLSKPLILTQSDTPTAKMGAQLSYGELIRKQFTPTKLFFHFLFWSFHWGIFAYGW
jgi:hypothetical protein